MTPKCAKISTPSGIEITLWENNMHVLKCFSVYNRQCQLMPSVYLSPLTVSVCSYMCVHTCVCVRVCVCVCCVCVFKYVFSMHVQCVMYVCNSLPYNNRRASGSGSGAP